MIWIFEKSTKTMIKQRTKLMTTGINILKEKTLVVELGGMVEILMDHGYRFKVFRHMPRFGSGFSGHCQIAVHPSMTIEIII